MPILTIIRHFLVNQCLYTFRLLTRSKIVRLLLEAKRQTDIHDLLTRLASCGQRIHIQWPVVITGPEMVHFCSDISLAAYVHIWGDGEVYIGNRVMIGTHTSITSMTHDYTIESMYYTNIKKRVIIEDDVWIGSNCVIMAGTRIGRGAVIGAGSVVTRDVQPNAIVVGVPARVMKMRQTQSNKKTAQD